MIQATVTETIQFFHLDPMDIVWHGNYVGFLERARSALLDQIDYNYPQMKASNYAWPVVDMRIKFVRPARFNQQIVIEATLKEWQNRMKIDYRIFDKISGEILTKAHTIQVAVDMTTLEMMYESPPVFLEKLKVHGVT